MRTVLISACVIAALSVATVEASSQTRFRITHEQDRRQTESIVVVGNVVNDDNRDALDVYVTAEALNVSGRIIATGIAHVGVVPARRGVRFAVMVPRVDGVSGFRVAVTSFRDGATSEAP